MTMFLVSKELPRTPELIIFPSEYQRRNAKGGGQPTRGKKLVTRNCQSVHASAASAAVTSTHSKLAHSVIQEPRSLGRQLLVAAAESWATLSIDALAIISNWYPLRLCSCSGNRKQGSTCFTSYGCVVV